MCVCVCVSNTNWDGPYPLGLHDDRSGHNSHSPQNLGKTLSFWNLHLTKEAGKTAFAGAARPLDPWTFGSINMVFKAYAGLTRTPRRSQGQVASQPAGPFPEKESHILAQFDRVKNVPFFPGMLLCFFSQRTQRALLKRTSPCTFRFRPRSRRRPVNPGTVCGTSGFLVAKNASKLRRRSKHKIGHGPPKSSIC